LTAEAVEGTGPPTLQADIKARMFSAGTAALPKAGELHQPPPSKAGG
jgi:hypothetical protein